MNYYVRTLTCAAPTAARLSLCFPIQDTYANKISFFCCYMHNYVNDHRMFTNRLRVDKHKPVMATVWREVYYAATRTMTASRFLPVKKTVIIKVNKASPHQLSLTLST